MSLDAVPTQSPPRCRAGGRALAAITLAAAAVLAVAARGRPAPSPGFSPAAAVSSPAAAAQTLAETGSSLMAPLFALWGPTYHARFSQVTVRTTSSSSGTGISAAAAGTADIGASDAYLSPATLAKYPHLVNFQPLPPSVVPLSGTQIARIKG